MPHQTWFWDLRQIWHITWISPGIILHISCLFSGIVDPIRRQDYPLDHKPYTTLMYSNGPGYSMSGQRVNPETENTRKYRQTILTCLVNL